MTQRFFKIEDRTVYSSRMKTQLGAPFTQLGIVLPGSTYNEDFARILYRAYHLGREDMKRDFHDFLRPES